MEVYVTTPLHATSLPQHQPHHTTMIGYSVFILAAGFQVIASQGPPPNLPQECLKPPPVKTPQDCCKIPPFFTDSDFAECGFQKLDDSEQHQRRGPPDCSKQLCMLKKYNLLKEDSIDHEALGEFMDQWGKNNEAFQPAVAAAKERCVGRQLPGPPHICEANKLVFCVSSTLFTECPVWEPSDNCRALKDHIDLCKPFFPKQ